jgi:hypothetical protein
LNTCLLDSLPYARLIGEISKKFIEKVFSAYLYPAEMLDKDA